MMQELLNQILETVGMYVPVLLAGLAVLLVGWLAAMIIAAMVKGIIKRTSLKDKLTNWFAETKGAGTVPVEKYVSRVVFYFLMLFVLVAFFQTLGLTLITEPLNNLLNQIMQFAPQLLGALALFLIAWIIAATLRLLLTKVLTAVKFDEQLGNKIAADSKSDWSMTKVVANVTYWLVFLLFLPAILTALSIQGQFGPLQAMISKVLEFLPNIFTAVMIIIVGWFLANIVKRIVINLLTAVGADNLSEKTGLKAVFGKQKLSGLIGLVVYIIILIPVFIAALNTLALEAITNPASEMLGLILSALPAVFAATLVIIVSYVLGRVVANWATNLLAGFGFNNIFVNLGLSKSSAVKEKKSPSDIAGHVLLAIIMVFAVIEAANLLGFFQLSDLLAEFLVFTMQIVMGLIIFGLGLFLANWISGRILEAKKSQSALFALMARISIMVLAGAMALRQMGLAEDIINMTFGLILGAGAVAAAIAFGIGGREYAARQIEKWSKKAGSDVTRNQ